VDETVRIAVATWSEIFPLLSRLVDAGYRVHVNVLHSVAFDVDKDEINKETWTRKMTDIAAVSEPVLIGLANGLTVENRKTIRKDPNIILTCGGSGGEVVTLSMVWQCQRLRRVHQSLMGN
jgi:hypothetical protein